MNRICEMCAGRCCSFRNLNISFTSGKPGDSIGKILGKTPLDQLVRRSGKPVQMKWFAADYETHRAIVFECEHQTKEGLCGIYDDRPDMCRSWKCDALTGKMKLGPVLQSAPPQTPKRLRNITRYMLARIRKSSVGPAKRGTAE